MTRGGDGGDTPTVRSTARTDRGLVRRRNEDTCLDRPERGLWAVADGMGGHARGDHASRLIVERLDACNPDPSSLSGAAAAVADGLRQAHDRLRAAFGGGDEVCGSTVVVLVARGDRFAALWAGDSRLYLRRAGRLHRLTRDHSVVQELIEAGRLRPEEAEAHPMANAVTRAVGAAAELELERIEGELCAGDRLLLCSDGLTRMVDDATIGAILGERDQSAAADRLIGAALRAGGADNVTVVLVDRSGQHEEEDDPDRTLPPRAGGGGRGRS